MAAIRIFSIAAFFGFAYIPGDEGISEAVWSAIVADGKNAVVFRNDAGTDLSVGILAAHGCESGNAHKKLIPAQIFFL